MTIYRTWPDMAAVLSDLMTREWGEVVAAAVGDADGSLGPDATVADHLVAVVVATCRALRDNELFVRIVELDPELLLPYLLARRGRSQDAILARLVPAVEAGQWTGEVVATFGLIMVILGVVPITPSG